MLAAEAGTVSTVTTALTSGVTTIAGEAKCSRKLPDVSSSHLDYYTFDAGV